MPAAGLLPNEGYYQSFLSPRILLDLSPGSRANETRATCRLRFSQTHPCSRSGCQLHRGVRSVGSNRAALRFNRRLGRQCVTRKSTAHRRHATIWPIGDTRCNGGHVCGRQASTEICVDSCHGFLRCLEEARCLFLAQAEGATPVVPQFHWPLPQPPRI